MFNFLVHKPHAVVDCLFLLMSLRIVNFHCKFKENFVKGLYKRVNQVCNSLACLTFFECLNMQVISSLERKLANHVA